MRITIGDSDYMVEIAAVDEMTNVCNCYLMQTISWISATIRCLYEKRTQQFGLHNREIREETTVHLDRCIIARVSRLFTTQAEHCPLEQTRSN